MKGIRVFTTVSCVLAGAITVGYISKYVQWKQALLQRLQTQSCVTETALGSVEYHPQGGGPVVLFVHGTPGGYDQSVATADLYKHKHFTTLAVSRPGYLRTPLHQKSPEAQADLYAALLDSLGIQKVTILGISGGGPSALQFALRHPTRCNGLIMLCAVSRSWPPPESLVGVSPLQRLLASLVERFIFFNNFSLFFLEVLQRWRRLPIPAAFVQSLAMPQLRAAGYVNDIEQFARIAEYPLEQITAPTLVLHGEKDTNVLIKDAELVAQKIPQAQFVIDKGGDHYFFITRKERIGPLLLEFLDEQVGLH